MADAWIEETLSQTISSLTTQHHFKSQFSALTTNADRVQLCLAQKDVQRWADLFVSKFSVNRIFSKCSTTALKYREDGNDHFRRQKFDSAIPLYTKAICFAPQTVDNTSELALAFGNRSAAYFQVGQHENALKDVNVALALGYGQFKSATKLQLRKCDCLIRLGHASEAEELLHFMQKPTGDENDTKRWIELFGRISLDDDKKKGDSNPKAGNVSLISKLTNKGLFKSNEKMSSFSTKVAAQYDEVKGRHLVAKEDIEFGDILAVSRPYVTLLDSKNDVLKYCHHCCRNLESIRPIPCTDCSSVVYCSEECRTESVNSYHLYECGQTDLLVQLPKFARMSLRLLYRAGMDQIRSVVNFVPEHGSYISEQAEDHYSHVYQLVHHSDGPLKDLNMSYQEMLISSIVACLLLQLAKKSNFSMNTKKEEKLIGGILLCQLLQSRYNTFGYSPLYNEKEPQILGGVGSSSSVLLDLYPLYASTLNHACKANARLKSPNNQHVCLQAAQSISAGTEITIPYLGDDAYDLNNPSIPPELFNDRYLVKCFCTECTYYAMYYARNTPFGVSAAYLALSCSACDHLMEHSSVHKSESEVFTCTNCRLTMNNVEMKRRYLTFGQLESSFFELYRSDERPIWKMLKIVEQLEGLLHRNSLQLGIFHSTLAGYYRLTGQMGKAWSCLEQFLSIYGRAYGKESVVFLGALELVQEAVLNLSPMMMEVFEQQHNELYQGYLVRMEQLKQLKRKYYPDY